MSSLTWLDFSDAERRRALQVVEILGRPETRDELGLGAIRDAFAEAMFPGMSTVQRRARYFLFVPWTFRQIERRHAGQADPLERARKEELRLVEALLDAGEEDGVIGGRARKNLRQVPSMIYWQGLARWGIRLVSGTREQWGRQIVRSTGPAVDDDGQLVAHGASWWHGGLPEPPDDWPSRARLTLRRHEADYLRERIRDRCPGTMLATLAEREAVWPEVDFAWELDIPELPGRQSDLLQHARVFSETMHGAALLYNHALAVDHEDEEKEAEYEASLLNWASEQRGPGRDAVSLSATWTLLAEIGSRHSHQTRVFIEDWFRLAEMPERVLSDPSFRQRVKYREREVKGRQARLSFDAARETWRGAAGAGQLEYRWASTQRQLLDIMDAEAD